MPILKVWLLPNMNLKSKDYESRIKEIEKLEE
jgi:hypothetical protein